MINSCNNSVTGSERGGGGHKCPRHPFLDDFFFSQQHKNLMIQVKKIAGCVERRLSPLPLPLPLLEMLTMPHSGVNVSLVHV